MSHCFSKQFEVIWASRLWVSGVLVLEFGPILAWYRFPAAEEFVVVFDVFFRLMMRQMFSIGERSGLQAGQFSTRTLLLWSHAVVIAAVCGFVLSPQDTTVLLDHVHIWLPFCMMRFSWHLQMARRIVFTDSGFWKYSWAHLVMSMTESCWWVMQCLLRAQRPWASNKGLRPCPLSTEISPVSLNLLMMLCTVDDAICKAFAIWRWGMLFLKYSTIFYALFHRLRASAHLLLLRDSASHPFYS